MIDWNTLDEGFAAFMGEKDKFTIISINNKITHTHTQYAIASEIDSCKHEYSTPN